MVERTCCFIGHRKIDATEELKNKLYNIIEKLITDGNIDTFLFGSRSEFNSLCYDIVTRLKEKYPDIKRIYVRAEFPIIDDSYKAYLLESYEDTYYPESINGSGKAAYIKRNREMIDKSSVCVVYYSEDYEPPRRKASKQSVTYHQPKSGTRTAYEYAVRKGKRVVNVANQSDYCQYSD